MRTMFPLILSLAAISVIGCRDALPDDPDYDGDQALSVLTTALDAWKMGQAGALVRRKPVIRFGDDDWKSGARLDAYAIQEPSIPLGAFRDVTVNLDLRDRQGRPVRKTVTYQISLEPGVTVLRSDN